MAPKIRRASAEDVLRRWGGLSLEQRQNLMSWDDPSLVERIKEALQALFQKQMWMNTLGIKLDAASDPFAASTLFTSAFEFTWQISRSARSPHVVLIDPACMPVMAMKPPFLEGDRLFSDFGKVLPDLLSERSGRWPLPKARWKDLWNAEPSSVAAMEQQLVKLVEQALWAMGSDPALETPEANSSLEEERSSVSNVPLEPWMLESEVNVKTGAPKKKKHKLKKQQRALAHAAVAVAPEAVAEAPVELDEKEKEEEEDGAALEDGAGLVQPSSEVLEEQEDVVCWRPPAKPLPSLLPHQAMPHPKQLVCYVWSQTSQLESNSTFQKPSVGTARPSSGGDPQASTAFSRGQWTGPCSSGAGMPMPLVQPSPSLVLSAVVRKTFVDIDDPNERLSETTRTTRSLSPVHLRERWAPVTGE